MAVPNIFGTATSAIPLSQLDQNFATAITLGNTAVYLGNTTTSLGNVTLTNVTISSGTSNIAANVSTAVGLLPEANGGTGTTTGYYGFKNRIINGAMVIDQRNAGASVTQIVGNTFVVDRWFNLGSVTSKFTSQQNAGSLSAANRPTGFINYLGNTSSAATSLSATDYYLVVQRIEGLNMADFNWGSASAVTVNLSFWVRSSLTGTFGGSIQNSALDRSYPFTYTISVANTWEQKSITIAGDTSGTWLTTNGVGAQVVFSLGTGTTFSGTSGAWAGANYVSATGATSVVGTSGATLYITGVQLEKGSTATSFDYRPFGTELALCQRYYEQTGYGIGRASSASNMDLVWSWKVEKRAAPSSSGVLFNGTNAVQQLGRAAVNANSVSNVFQVSVNNIGTSIVSADTGLTTSAVCTSAGTSYIIAGSAEL